MLGKDPRVTRDDIHAELQRADAWKVRVMCAAAAERTAPLFRHFGRSGSLATFEAGLDAAWSAVTSRPGSSAKQAARRLPETQQDDSHNPEYYAGRMLEILVRALDYASTGRRTAAAACIECTAGICDDIDVLLTAAPGQTFRYDPKHPPPPGKFEAKELAAQAELLALLREASPSAAAIDGARLLARERATQYESVVPKLRARLSRRGRRKALP